MSEYDETTELTYCIRGCTRRVPGNDDEPVIATNGQLCRPCANRFEKWLREIPEHYALLPQYVLPMTDRDANPDSKATKRTNAPAPLRVDVIDLLDERRGRKWLATEATNDRRGTLGTVHAIATYIRESRNTDTRLKPTVSRETDTIIRNLDWLLADPSLGDTYEEIRILHRQLSDAIGVYRQKPVGRCTVDIDDKPCGGPLLPHDNGVNCIHCGAHWDQNLLRFLGRTIEAQEDNA